MIVDPAFLTAVDVWGKALLSTILIVQTSLQVYFARRAAKKAARVEADLKSDYADQRLSIAVVRDTLDFETRAHDRRLEEVKSTLLDQSSHQIEKISDVKETLAFETKVQNKKLDEIHKFVNGSYGLALRTAALALKRIAALTNSVLDLEAAKEATDAADAHDFRQVEFDAELNELKRQSDIAKADAKAAEIKAI